MSQRHTLNHVRELYVPSLFDRTPEIAWAKAGRKETREVAREKARKILKEHNVTPLENEVKQRISEIVKSAEKELPQSS